jgi:hypothetical protein
MAKSRSTTTAEYPVDEFVALVKEKIFSGKDIKVEFVICEVGNRRDDVPGYKTVTQVRVSFEGVAEQL